MDAAYASELLLRQDALQAEAAGVIADLDLPTRLRRVGVVEQIGSSVSGLMVWRDIDFVVTSPALTSRAAWETMLPVIAHPRMTRVAYTNEVRELKPSDRRHYFVLHHETGDGDDWKIDVTFWVVDEPREHRTRALELSRLDRETRLRILWLKDVWHRLPVYPYEVGGTDVYDAVLEHGVRTPEEFDAYLQRRGLPSRGIHA